MNQTMNRRNLLMTLGGIAAVPAMGAFANVPSQLDANGNIFLSPNVRENFLDNAEKLPNSMIRINANENPYGPPMSARKAVCESVATGSRYSWKELENLTAKIAKKEGVTPAHIMMGPGSSDLLEKVALVLFKNGGNVVSADPTYMSLVKVAEATGATWKAIPCKEDWSHDLKAMEAAIDKDTKMVYICNPNNPMGSITAGQELMDFCARVSEKVPVFIDEAYLELAVGANTETMVPLLAKNKNVIIARTFSKIMGMAGLRVGYIAALPATLDNIQKITRGGMGITQTSIAAAMASLDDAEFQDSTRKLNHEVKQYLCKNLERMGYKYVTSYTNFVIFPINIAGKEMLQKMAAKGIMVRSYEIKGKPWCRVSMGTMDEIKQFVSAFESMS